MKNNSVSFRTNLWVDGNFGQQQTPVALSSSNIVERAPSENAKKVEADNGANPVKVIADKHAVVKLRLERTVKELTKKKEQMKLLERDVYLTEGNLQIAEQHLRGINEKFFHSQNSLTNKEKRHEELLVELVEVRWKCHLGEEKYKALESQYVDFQVEKAIRIDQVSEIDMKIDVDHQDSRSELEELKEKVEKYQEYKDRLAAKDLELEHILCGDKLVQLEGRKAGIRDAFARREARVEGIYMEIDEKNEAVTKLKQSVLIKEKQNQAKLRKLQRELEEKGSTERHLKQTVEYLDRQIDPALSFGSENGSNRATAQPNYNRGNSSFSTFDNNCGKSVYFNS